MAELVRRGHRVFAIAPGIDEALAEQLENLGVTPVSLTLSRASLNPFSGLTALRKLKTLLRQLQPDVLIAYTIKPIILGAAAARATGVERFVPIVTGLGYAFLGGRNLKRLLVRELAVRLYRRAFRAAHVVLFQNDDDRADFRHFGILRPGQNSAVINGSGVDLDHFHLQPVPPQLSFLMIARFLKDKGIREFAQASGRLKQAHPEISIRLAGWADDSPDSLAPGEIAAMNANGIENLGQLEDVRPALGECSVYVLPSYREGTPRSVLEAMATGRAIITTDAPGCRETVVAGENGWLVPPQDAEALYQAMLRFVLRPELCIPMAAASRRIAEQKYDVRKVNAVILEHAGL